MTRLSKPLVALLAFLAVCAVPLLASNPYTLSVIVIALLYAYLALSWNVIGGIAGQLSLGHAAWFGIGSYTSTVLFLNFGISPWIGMFAGAALAGAIAAIVGLPCFRLRGAYFALATIATTMVLRIVVENTHEWLGGPRGLDVTLLYDAPLYFQHTRKEFYYAVVVVLVLAALAVNHAILRSRFGAYLAAIRSDHEASLALGVDVQRCKLVAFVISAAMTAVGGTFYAQLLLFISPEKVFGAALSVQIAVTCIVGGRGTLWGPVLGAFLLLGGEELARRFTGNMVGADMLLYGLLLMIVISIEPRGIIAMLSRAARGADPATKAQGRLSQPGASR